MSGFVLTCCSTADMPAGFFERRNIPYVCFHVKMDDREFLDDLGKSISYEEFYKKIELGSTPTTSQVNVDQYIDMFEPVLESGQDILHITLSSGLSGTFNSACIAKDILTEKYPDRKIYIVDSLGASSGYGLLVTLACDMRDNGKSIDETYNWLMENRLKLHHWFFSTDLTSYYRGGRISKTSAIFGTVLQICPLLNMDNLGRLIPREKYRGKKKVIEEIVNKMEEHAQNGLDYSGKCYISQSACMEDARRVADLIEKKFKNLDGKVMINNIGTVIGAHTGPGTIALYFLGDLREN